MAEKKEKTGTEIEKKAARKPKLTRLGFQVSIIVISLCFIAQYIIALAVYAKLPALIPAWWLGFTQPEQLVQSYLIFIIFPAAELVLLAIGILSPINEKSERVMENSKATTLTVLALLFAVLQGSFFNLAGR